MAGDGRYYEAFTCFTDSLRPNSPECKHRECINLRNIEIGASKINDYGITAKDLVSLEGDIDTLILLHHLLRHCWTCSESI